MVDAAKIYSSTMKEWIKSSNIPIPTQALNDQHMMMQEAATDHLKSHLKGPANVNFRLPFLNRLQGVIRNPVNFHPYIHSFLLFISI